ncbi:hypothetical protein KKG66_11155, partial [bacterium]|nr:hypothetical protein [bacterium]
MQTRHTYLIIALLLVSSISFAQPDSLWSRTYGGIEGDYCCDALRTADGGYLLAGTTNSYGEGASDFWIVKTDESGDSLWSRTYGSQASESCNDAIQTSDGGSVLAGTVHENLNPDVWVVKTNGVGDSLWSWRFDGGGEDHCDGVIQANNGDYVIAGRTQISEYDTDLLLVKMDTDGDSIWSRTYGGIYSDDCQGVIQTDDG